MENGTDIQERFSRFYENAKKNCDTYSILDIQHYGLMLEVYNKNKKVIMAVYENDNKNGVNLEFVNENTPNTFLSTYNDNLNVYDARSAILAIIDEFKKYNNAFTPKIF